jgi:uncharacterized membrane protein YhaH (DUF805 family)
MLGARVHLLAIVGHPGAWGALAGGFFLLWMLFAAAILVFSIYCTWRIAEKSGYPGAYSLLMLIPVVNIIVQLYWVFTEWPIETELRKLRGTNR